MTPSSRLPSATQPSDQEIRRAVNAPPPRHRSLWHWVVAPFWAAGFCVLGPLTVFLVSCWLGGYRLQPVLTGSMAPTYPPGSLVVVAPVDPGDVTIGTPI